MEQIEIKFKTTFLYLKKDQYHWLITINGEEFNYFQGLAHFTPYYKPHSYVRNRKPENGQTNTNLNGWLHVPTLDDVMYCLLSDFDCGNMTYDDFCSDLGYDTDSINALKTYHACQSSGTKLKKAIGYKLIEEFRIKLEDY